MTKAEALAFAVGWHSVYDGMLRDKGIEPGYYNVVLWVADVRVDGIDPGDAWTPANLDVERAVS